MEVLRWTSSSSPLSSMASSSSSKQRRKNSIFFLRSPLSPYIPRTRPLKPPPSLCCTAPKVSDASITQPIALEGENQSSYAVLAKEARLKKIAAEVVDDLSGTCIYLIGMMGSGKSTVGKILSEALGYYFFDSDKVVEEAVGGASISELFKEENEEGFRDAEEKGTMTSWNESKLLILQNDLLTLVVHSIEKVLKQLSCLGRLVIATGGGIVVRPMNWSYMRHGITVFLDAPLEALAKRVVAAGMDSRPLLGQASGEDEYHQALKRLSEIYEKRSPAYKNADATVSLQEIASVLGCEDVSFVTPTVIAVQVLEEIKKLIDYKKWQDSKARV